MLDERSKQAVSRIAAEAQELFGDDLVCLVLYGSAAGRDFVPGQSNLNFAIVLKQVRFEHLQSLNKRLAGWHELGAAMPLLLDRQTLERSRDVFPMEFQDIKEMHELLVGENVFTHLEIDWRHLRYQAEHEVRGKLLRLRALYAEVGADRERLHRLLLDSVKTFLVVMRALIRLREHHSTTSFADVLRQFESQTGSTFPAMGEILHIKLDRQAWPADTDAMMQMLRSYLAEVEVLAELVDAIQQA